MAAIFIIWNDATNSLQRVILHADRPLTIESGGPTEEGYSYTTEHYEYHRAEGVVTRETDTRALDCDGRLDRRSLSECPLSDLAAHEHNGTRFPVWRRVEANQRDYSAEAMGY